MTLSKPDNLMRQSLDIFYQGRIQELKALQLKDIVNRQRLCVFILLNIRVASAIVKDLLETHISSNESWWESLTNNPNFSLKLAHSVYSYRTEKALLLKQEQDRALNRCLRQFMTEYVGVDGRIDWEKLLCSTGPN